MSKVRIVLEAAKSVHPMAVHAYPSGGGKFTVHATGSKVQHVKKGDTVSSSDLDDLSDAGHKVKEVKKPVNEANHIEEAGMPASVIKHKEKLAGMSDKELASHLEGKSEKDLRDMAARHGYGWNKQTKTGSDHYVKRVASGLKEGVAGSGGYRTKDGTYVPFKSFEKAGQEVRAKRAEAGRALADADKKTRDRAKANEEVEQVDEKLTPQAKSAVRQALGPKTPGNEMRKSSKAARTLISVLKTNKKNVAEAEDAGSVKQKAIQKYIEQGYSYNDAVQKAEIYLKKKKLM
jgi:hypothetical protein